ncbi:IclR family transcriptional regulator [Geminicoccus harenae]|uniref:IclR family transcriptional regulator n=2 Tax=Geminicoccus harenae TaxID=2498453 RepID=UPI001C940069|nr:IclR family transcriptional regulator [Geminicoccus harenae]
MATADPSQAGVPGTAAFGKFMRVLQAVADAPGEHGVAALARLTGLPRPTVHRIVAALEAEGLVVPAPGSGRYALGTRLMALASQSWDRLDLRRLARPHLQALRDRLDETVHLALPAGDAMVYVDKLESRQVVRMTSRIGTPVALHSSSVGKAWLAALPEAEATALVARLTLSARTPHTIQDSARLLEEVDRTRASGAAIDRQENELDICCYGQAIPGPDRRPLGCVSVSMPRYRFEAAPAAPIEAALRACVAAIAAELGTVLPA